MSEDPLLVLQTSAPALGETDAIALLSAQYGINASLEPLVSERDQNFLVLSDDGNKFVLKIANAAELAEVTDFQSAALDYVAIRAPAFPVPRVLRTTNGDRQVAVQAADGGKHRVRLLSWMDGTPLRFAGDDTDVAQAAGDSLAKLDRALQGFKHPAADHALLWDMKRAAGLLDLLPAIENGDLRARCAQQIQEFQRTVLPQFPGLRAQVIYNDLNPSNLLVDEGNPQSLAGIIDFGDMVYAPLVVDAAVAAAYLCVDEGDPFRDVVSFLSAYTNVLRLDSTEVGLLFDLILMRHLMTIVITHWRAARYPQNRDYILRNEPRARAILNRVSDLDKTAVIDRFRAASATSGTEV